MVGAEGTRISKLASKKKKKTGKVQRVVVVAQTACARSCMPVLTRKHV